MFPEHSARDGGMGGGYGSEEGERKYTVKRAKGVSKQNGG